jgi:UV excision repair protein RAD23
VEPSDTVGALKEKIEKDQGHSAATMKIIYSGEVRSIVGSVSETEIHPPGKILNDSKTIESLDIKEKDFLVVMVSKVRRPPIYYLRIVLIHINVSPSQPHHLCHLLRRHPQAHP